MPTKCKSNGRTVTQRQSRHCVVTVRYGGRLLNGIAHCFYTEPLPPIEKMTRFQLTYLTLLLVLTSCVSSNVLTYKNRQHFKENSIITSDTIFKLYQNVCYNKPRVIDEEYCYYLKLTFLDTTAAKTNKTLDLQTDTNIVKAEYGIFSVWNWNNENNKVSGRIEITLWDKDKVTLKENIVATDYRRKESKKFKGIRTFTRKDGQ